MKKNFSLLMIISINLIAMDSASKQIVEAMLTDHINPSLSFEQFESFAAVRQKEYLNSLLCGVIGDFDVFPNRINELRRQLQVLIEICKVDPFEDRIFAINETYRNTSDTYTVHGSTTSPMKELIRGDNLIAFNAMMELCPGIFKSKETISLLLSYRVLSKGPSKIKTELQKLLAGLR